MNRLRGTRCYLSGAMDKAPDRGVQWRVNLYPVLKGMGVTILDPCNKPISDFDEGPNFANVRSEYLEKGDYDKVAEMMKPVRAVDLRMTDVADFLIVNLDLDIFACGTMEEIFLANRQKKPILIHCPQGKKKLSPWLFGAIPHQMFFDTWRDLLNYTHYIDKHKQILTLKRWVFFDFNNR
jgi:hypothetical protein